MSHVYQLFADPVPTVRAQSNRFDEFWAAFPKRTLKAQAKAKYEAIIRGGFRTKTRDKDSGGFMELELEATEDELIEGAKRYTASLIDKRTYKRVIEDRFIPSAVVWLNQGRWQDD